MDEQTTPAASDDEQPVKRDALVDMVNRYGYVKALLWTMQAIISGWFIFVVAGLLLIGAAPGFYRFTGGKFFTDFVGAWFIPMMLQGPAAHIYKVVPVGTWEYPLVLFVYGILCTVIAVFQFSSAIYGAATTFNALYTGSNGWYFAGIYYAAILSFILVIIEAWHLIAVGNLIPARAWKIMSQGYERTDTV